MVATCHHLVLDEVRTTHLRCWSLILLLLQGALSRTSSSESSVAASISQDRSSNAVSKNPWAGLRGGVSSETYKSPNAKPPDIPAHCPTPAISLKVARPGAPQEKLSAWGREAEAKWQCRQQHIGIEARREKAAKLVILYGE